MTWERALEAEARRIYARYATEFVEAFGFCPWAERARLDGRVRVEVSLAAGDALEETLGLVEVLSRDATTEVGIVVFPRLAIGRVDFERFVQEVRAGDEQRAGRGGPSMALAAFHPDAKVDLGEPRRLVSFIRRSPDPTIQLVRRSVLDAVRKPEDSGTGYVDPASSAFVRVLETPSRPPLDERIAAANLREVERRGVAACEAVLASIARDRADSYARILDGAEPSARGHLER